MSPHDPPPKSVADGTGQPPPASGAEASPGSAPRSDDAPKEGAPPLSALPSKRIVLLGLAAIAAIGLLYCIAVPQTVQKARLDWQDWTGNTPRGGVLFIEPPQVYTRERLVNDRFAQANWLNRELENYDKEANAVRAAVAARVVERSTRTELTVKAGGDAPAAKDAGAANEEGKNLPSLEVQLDQVAALDRRLEYRNKVRTELMDTQLDDSHDLDGNTLYRFNFDTVVMPWADTRGYPGTAVFVITAMPTRSKLNGSTSLPESNNAAQSEADNALREARDDIELLQSWQREIQQFFTRVVKFRTMSFDQGGDTENKTDPKEDIFFDFFLRKTLFESYTDLLSAGIAKSCNSNIKICAENDNFSLRHSRYDTSVRSEIAYTSEDREYNRRSTIARWLGITYKADTIEFPPAMEAQFRRAVAVAHRINILQWPKIGPVSYRSQCIEKLQNQDQKQVQDECLIEYKDSGYKRAIIRLINTTNSLTTYIQSQDKSLFTINFLENSNEPPAGFTEMQGTFSSVLPDGSDVAALRDEIDKLVPSKTSLPSLFALEATCQEIIYPNRQMNTMSKIDILTYYGKCQFLKSHAGKVENILAKFIFERVSYPQLVFREAGVPITRFVDIEIAGCGLDECRIEVRPKSRDDFECLVDCTSKSKNNLYLDNICNKIAETAKGEPNNSEIDRPANTAFSNCITAAELRRWLEEPFTNLAVYEVNPHTGGPVNAGRVDNVRSGRIGASAGDLGGGLAHASQSVDRAIGVTTNVIGFGLVDRNSTVLGPEKTVFGWVIRPEANIEGRWMPNHHRLSAILSVPSWWKRLRFDIKACWTTPERARELGYGRLTHPESVCENPSKAKSLSQDSSSANEPDESTTKDGSPANEPLILNYTAQLPRRTEDVTERFRFDFIKAPYLDQQWLVSNPRLRLEAGRPGKLVILGGRLWRGTVATIMGQPADKITVLPDMKGVIAEFDCVITPPEMKSAVPATPPSIVPPGGPTPNQPPQPPTQTFTMQNITVWTSEGRTQDVPVEVYPFAPRGTDTACDARLPPKAGNTPALEGAKEVSSAAARQ